ncbi:hypothetical protein ACX27_05360 [Nostoc piscinale CENA21]|uniref:Uncharacterized protein n=1 Tax=Nostoc piscinale CENA21 TaxID=224013 RepID=A0A0M4T215_9NOSO|nr:hypothetical protein ACX27_05360 [Nostoc piscinale CENA21]
MCELINRIFTAPLITTRQTMALKKSWVINTFDSNFELCSDHPNLIKIWLIFMDGIYYTFALNKHYLDYST